MTRVLIIFALAFTAGLAIPTGSSAQESGRGFGLGIVVGEPTGVTARFNAGQNNFQVHAAWSFSNNSAFQASGDYLRSGRFNIEEPIDYYFGAGMRAKFGDKTRVGIRIPLGVNYFFDSEPVELFGEVVPIMDVAPDTKFDLNGAFGIRYYFGG